MARGIVFKIRLNELERATISLRAKKAGKEDSEWAREYLTADEVVAPKDTRDVGFVAPNSPTKETVALVVAPKTVSTGRVVSTLNTTRKVNPKVPRDKRGYCLRHGLAWCRICDGGESW